MAKDGGENGERETEKLHAKIGQLTMEKDFLSRPCACTAWRKRSKNNSTTVMPMRALSFDDRLAFLVEREHTLRANRQLTNRLRRAKLKLQATLEDLDLHARRGLDKTLLRELATARFIKDHLNILITGPTGVGKTYLACAIAHSACRNGFTARYLRGSPGYSRTSSLPAATAPIPGSSYNSPRPISSSSTTGA